MDEDSNYVKDPSRPTALSVASQESSGTIIGTIIPKMISDQGYE